MTKKWVTPITDEQYDWVKDTAEATGVSGADIVRAAVELAMKDREFKSSLAESQLRLQLASLTAKKSALEAQEKTLQKRLKEAAIAN